MVEFTFRIPLLLQDSLIRETPETVSSFVGSSKTFRTVGNRSLLLILSGFLKTIGFSIVFVPSSIWIELLMVPRTVVVDVRKSPLDIKNVRDTSTPEIWIPSTFAAVLSSSEIFVGSEVLPSGGKLLQLILFPSSLMDAPIPTFRNVLLFLFFHVSTFKKIIYWCFKNHFRTFRRTFSPPKERGCGHRIF